MTDNYYPGDCTQADHDAAHMPVTPIEADSIEVVCDYLRHMFDRRKSDAWHDQFIDALCDPEVAFNLLIDIVEGWDIDSDSKHVRTVREKIINDFKADAEAHYREKHDA